MKSKNELFQQSWVHGMNISDLSDADFNTEIIFTTSNELGSVSIPVTLTEEKSLKLFAPISDLLN
jgi:hypothetical protein